MGVVGTIVRLLIGFFIIYLVLSSIYFVVRGMDVQNPWTQFGTRSSTITTSTASSASSAFDNMSLADLQKLSFSNSTSCGSLLDPHYWDAALKTSGNTTLHIIPNTVYGFAQSTNEWTTFFKTNMTNPPFWLSLGLSNYTSRLGTLLAAKVMGTNNLTLAAGVLKNYTAYAGGLTLGGLDFVSWNGVTSLKTYISTGNAAQAISESFGGQLYQLFVLSQDCSLPTQQRAQFFGEALAITGIVVATSGKDGFDPKFETLLSEVRLLDVWSKIKAYLKDIGLTSPAIAYETTMILEELAKKFPATFDDVAPFTSDRIDLMIQALKKGGLTPDQIGEKVSELPQLANGAASDGDVAERADEISYEVTGTIMAHVGKDFTLSLGGARTTRYIQETFLQKEILGFVGSENAAFKITVHRGTDISISYYVYQGGNLFEPTLPEGQASPGDVVPISIDLLPLDAFVKGLPAFQMTNDAYLSWVADSVIVKDFTVTDNVLQIHFVQSNPFSKIQDFTISGTVQKYPGSSTNYGGAYAEFTITDYDGNTQTLRLRHNGYDVPQFQLLIGGFPNTVSLISYDGLRLSIVYSSQDRVKTVYLVPPSADIYDVGDMHPYSGEYLNLIAGKYSNAFMLDNVQTVRTEESTMLFHGSEYVAGRLGAEIAYVIATDKLGMKDVVLQDPAIGGRDLYTKDNTVGIQTRLIRHPIDGSDLPTTIRKELVKLVESVRLDYNGNPDMKDGYAILSYIDTDGSLKTIIVEVLKP